MKQFLRKIWLNILLKFYEIGAFFGDEKAISAVEDITLALDENFINIVREIMTDFEEHPEKFESLEEFLSEFQK